MFRLMMNGVFRDMQDRKIVVHLNDILVYSKTKEEHFKDMEEVFRRLQQNQLITKGSKCELEHYILTRAALLCTAPTAATAAFAATASTTAMASPTVLTFDAEGRAVDFDVWVDDLQLFLQCDSRDGVSHFYHTSDVSSAPTATADSTVRSQWTTHDAVARLAVRSHLPPAERAHFGQYKTAQSLYNAVVARYSSPATAALSRLMLLYLFPDLTAFATVADLVTHLRTSDARYRAALPTDFCAKNPPPHVHHPLLPSHPPP
ncbi:unnamed protein product [Closterium sp. NIES-54]